MSTSRHPIALRLENAVGGDAKLLATVMALPLLDGIFPALVLAGALEETAGPFPVVGAIPIGVVQVGLLVFGGSATVAVVLAEMDGTRMERVRTILLVGGVLTAGAALEAAIAPTLASVLTLHVFERFAALVIVAIAAKTASARIGEYLPRPGVIVGAGLIASLDLSNPTLEPVANTELIWLAAGSAIAGTAFALLTALLAPHLRARMAIDRFRFGSAVALGLLALSILQLPVGSAPLLVIAVTALFAFEPDAGSGVPDEHAVAATDDVVAATDGGNREPDALGDAVHDPPTDESLDEPAVDEPLDDVAEREAGEHEADHADEAAETSGDDEDDSPLDVDREPWL
ncbi:hypothetical protein G9C85_02005 [Halorubellus sp. JP-L1]|uniref:DUF5794 domain-containing protein n=1 Tax=Halorubellus sp. JP-L1 TaxID=2715753 RepID=UPI00140D91A4|nr:DUF5794 domain-containing protein [Halorubellus sp. JP-L1]NHN40410.1 hypothetical protein [Halorubellus sp. JP-L1]